VNKTTENNPPKKTEDESGHLKTKAINARNIYAEAHAFFKRPPPKGRTNLRDLRAQGEARIERAAKIYAQRRDELKAAYGGAVPADVDDKLWVYDDKAAKMSRDAWMHF